LDFIYLKKIGQLPFTSKSPQPITKYYLLMIQSNRYGKITGMEFNNQKPQWKMPKKISGANKRGIWTLSVG
jgi:hypothetical protein